MITKKTLTLFLNEQNVKIQKSIDNTNKKIETYSVNSTAHLDNLVSENSNSIIQEINNSKKELIDNFKNDLNKTNAQSKDEIIQNIENSINSSNKELIEFVGSNVENKSNELKETILERVNEVQSKVVDNFFQNNIHLQKVKSDINSSIETNLNSCHTNLNEKLEKIIASQEQIFENLHLLNKQMEILLEVIKIQDDMMVSNDWLETSSFEQAKKNIKKRKEELEN